MLEKQHQRNKMAVIGAINMLFSEKKSFVIGVETLQSEDIKSICELLQIELMDEQIEYILQDRLERVIPTLTKALDKEYNEN